MEKKFNELHGDLIVEVLSFLPIPDFCNARLTNRDWNNASLKSHETWANMYERLTQCNLPRSHLFQTVTLYSNHPLFRDHPLLWQNKRMRLYETLNLSLETHTGWEIDEALLEYWRLRTNPHVEQWTKHFTKEEDKSKNVNTEETALFLPRQACSGASDECTLIIEKEKKDFLDNYDTDTNKNQPYHYFSVVFQQLKLGEEKRGTKHSIQQWTKWGIQWHNVVSVCKLIIVIPLVVLMSIALCLLGFFKTFSYSAEYPSIEELSYHVLFGLLYGIWTLKFGADLIHYVQHIFFAKAGLHTYETVEKLVRNMLHTVLMLTLGTVSILLFHLRAISVLTIPTSATVALMPIMLLVLSVVVLFWIDSKDVRHYLSSLYSVGKVMLCICALLVLEAIIITLGFRIDQFVKVNYVVLFLPVDLLFVVVLVQFVVTSLACASRGGRRELKLSGVSFMDVFYIWTSLALLSSMMVIQIFLGAPELDSGYCFICLAIMALVWGIESAVTTISELSFQLRSSEDLENNQLRT